MPELPEVETIKNDLIEKKLPNLRIESARVLWPRSIETSSPQVFKNRISGQKIITLSRRAKYLIIHLSRDVLLIHLRMSGRIDIEQQSQEVRKHDRVILNFDDGRSLRFHDIRKFGRCYLYPNLEEIDSKLGPEPLSEDFKFRWFESALRSKSRMLKPLLLDQQFLSGLGNIYVDEALWDARLHPMQNSRNLSSVQIKALRLSIRKVLLRGIKNLGTSLGQADTNFYSVGKRRGRNQDELKVFRRTGEKCPRCKNAVIERIIVGQRSTHVCLGCQINN